MKPATNSQSQEERSTNWVTLLLISLGIILGSAFVLGPVLSGIDAVNQRVAASYHCPGAVEITEKRGPVVQVGSDPNSFGQSVEGLCTFADGSTKVIGNDEYAITSILGSLVLGALLGVGLAILFVPSYLLWKKRAAKADVHNP